MKKNKILKTLGLFGCAILLVAVSIAGTMAYLTDDDKVINTFTVGNVTITMDETDYDLYGQTPDSDDPVQENEYKLIPNHTYKKDTTIHVAAGSENCYIFVKIENGLNDDATVAIKPDWTSVDGEENVYYYKDVATAGGNYQAIESFKVFGDADVASYKDATIRVTGYAVQADGFTTAQAAWDATFGA